MFEIAKEKRNAQHNFRISSIRLTGEVLRLATQVEEEEDVEVEECSDEDQETAHEEVGDKKDDEDKEDDEEKQEDDEEDNDKQPLATLSKYLKSSSSDDSQLKKLNDSSCLNLINSKCISFYFKTIPRHLFDQICTECVKKRTQFLESLDEDTKADINNTFDGLLQYQHDTGLNNVLTYIDNQKQSISNKFSTHHNLLLIVELVIRSFSTYKKESKLSEAAYLRKFQQILDIALAQTKLEIREGETVCRSTRNMLIINQEEVEYGRRIDLLVTSEGLDEDDDTELCSIEFKKDAVSESVSTNQQGKNIRINACILNQNHLILNSSTLDLPYYDFTGRKAYLAQLFQFDDCYVAHKVGNFVLPKSLLELGQFRQSIMQLYIWKNETEKNNNKISLARTERQNSFALSDIANEVVFSSPPRSPRNVEPMKIFLSPSKGKKRTRDSIFEDEQ